MRRRIVVGVALVVAAMVPASSRAQWHTVRGVAWDSLRAHPLAGAFVTLGTQGRSTVADADGRFRFDSVPRGRHAIGVQHFSLDSIGLSGLSLIADVGDSTSEIVVAAPSFVTLWRRVCGEQPAPIDSGVVFGTVTDARDGRPSPHASVEAIWDRIEVGDKPPPGQKLDIRRRRFRSVTLADSAGRFGLCGVPDGVALQLQATSDSAASGVIDMLPEEWRVRRRDLRVAPVDSASVPRGAVVAIVTTPDGTPIERARVVTDGFAELRTDSRGRVMLRDVPVGTRQLEAFAIGRSPAAATVDVTAGDTATFAIQLRSINALDVVRVTASRRVRRIVEAMEERRRQGDGYFRDSTEIAHIGTMLGVFAQFPSAQVVPVQHFGFEVTMRGNLGRCTASVWINGARTDFQHLSAYRPEELALVEVYPSRMNVPAEFSVPFAECGAVAVWTKRELKEIR